MTIFRWVPALWILIVVPLTGCAKDDIWLIAAEFADDRFVVVGQHNPHEALSGPTAIYTSTDGDAWQEAVLEDGDEFVSLNDVTWGNGRWVAVGSSFFSFEAQEEGYPEEAGLVAYSDDGLEWSVGGEEVDPHISSVAYGNGLFVAVARMGDFYSSTDGESWLPADVEEIEQLYDRSNVTFGAGSFVSPLTLEGEPAVATSIDGQAWTIHNVGLDWGNRLSNLRYLDGEFVATVASYQFCEGSCPETQVRAAHSDDGIEWVVVTSDSEHGYSLSSISFGDGIYVAEAEDKLVVSSDLEIWDVTKKRGAGDHFYDVSYGANRFVVAGEDGIWTSADGESWARTFDYEGS